MYVLKQARGLPSLLFFPVLRALKLWLWDCLLLCPRVLAQVCVGVGGAGKKEKQLFSLGISAWFPQSVLPNTSNITFCLWPCFVSFPFTESQRGWGLNVHLETAQSNPAHQAGGNQSRLLSDGILCISMGDHSSASVGNPLLCLTTLTKIG